LFVSARDGDGRSTIVANLGIAFANAGQRAIILDADLRKPSQAAIFGLLDQPGLGDLLAKREIDDITTFLQTTDFEGLSLLSAGVHLSNPIRHFKSQFMKKLIDTLKAQADVILIDTPPGNFVMDTIVLADTMDAVVLVAAMGITPRQAVLEFRDELSNADAKLLGLALNKTPFSKEAIEYFRAKRRRASIKSFFVRFLAKLRGRRDDINWPALYRREA